MYLLLLFPRLRPISLIKLMCSPFFLSTDYSHYSIKENGKLLSRHGILIKLGVSPWSTPGWNIVIKEPDYGRLTATLQMWTGLKKGEQKCNIKSSTYRSSAYIYLLGTAVLSTEYLLLVLRRNRFVDVLSFFFWLFHTFGFQNWNNSCTFPEGRWM